MDRVSFLGAAKTKFAEIVGNERLLDADVSVLARPLTPEEAIGRPGRRDFPVVVGKERVLESRVLDSRGHAFTDSLREFLGTMREVLGLELDTSQNRAIFVATMNAVLAHLGMVGATVHCRDDDPEKCAKDIATHLLGKYGHMSVGLIGLNPAVAEELVRTFGEDRVRCSDLSEANIGKHRFGVEVWDGHTQTAELIAASDLVLLTGTTLVNGTFDSIWDRIQASGKIGLVYGVTAAGVCELNGIERICPLGQT